MLVVQTAETVLWPTLAGLLPDYPDIKVELSVERGFTDIVAGRYDVGGAWESKWRGA
jgi:DNA-binding transcriptional LysR family regulator